MRCDEVELITMAHDQVQ